MKAKPATLPRHVWRFCNAIPGSFTELSAEKLYEQALSATHQIVEVGVDQGRSASLLLHAAQITGAEVVLVDSWESVLIDNKAKVEKLIGQFQVNAKILHFPSQQAVAYIRDLIDLLHIDSNHYDENPAADCETWLPKLRSGGVVCFHDFEGTFPAVTEAVNHYTEGWENLGNWDSLAIRRKP